MIWPRQPQRWAWSAAGALAGLGLLVLLSLYLLQRERLLKEGGERLVLDQQRVAAALDQAFARAELRAAEIADMLMSGQLGDSQLIDVLKAKIMHDGELVQFGVLLEPDNPLSGKQRFAIAVEFGADGIRIENFVENQYDYWNKPWYAKTRDSADGWWSDPYFNDAAGGQDTLTFDYPLRDQDLRFVGMVSVSLSLERIVEMTATLGWGSGLSDYLLIDANQRILIAADSSIERAYSLSAATSKSATPLASWLLEHAKENAGRRIHEAAAGFSFASQPLQRVGWQLAAAQSDSTLIASLQRGALIAATAILLLSLLLGIAASRRINRLLEPLVDLTKSAEHLAAGEFERRIAISGELHALQPLAAALERSRLTLEQNLGLQREQRDMQQRALGQSQLSAQLQSQLLPADRVFVGLQMQAQINAALRASPTKTSCFYGFSALGPGQCGFYLGTTSGHAPDPLLLMTRLTVLLPTALRQCQRPSETLSFVLHQLRQSDKQDWQVNLLVGRLELGDGLLSLTSAAMPAPTLLSKQSQENLKLPVGPALRRDSAEQWQDWSTRLQPGDRLLLFTDALSSSSQEPAEIGPDRLQLAIERRRDAPTELLIRGVFEDIAELCGPQPAEDFALMVVGLGFRD